MIGGFADLWLGLVFEVGPLRPEKGHGASCLWREKETKGFSYKTPIKRTALAERIRIFGFGTASVRRSTIQTRLHK